MRSNISAGLRAQIAESLHKCYVLPVAMRCNARCTFCATLEYAPAPADEFMRVDGVEDAVGSLVRARATRFEVTGGGEPTLHPQLGAVLAAMRRAGAAYIKLYTNMARLVPGLDIDELNISRAHFEADRNQAIMRINGGSEALEDTVDRARAAGYSRIRLSVPLVRGGIDTPAAAREFVERAVNRVDTVVFRPLYPATPDRAALLPPGEATAWQEDMAALARDFTNDLAIEFDMVGCFRSRQTILASDLRLYQDWSLTQSVSS